MLSDFPMAPKLAQGSLHGASLSLSQLENFSQHEKLRAVLQAGRGEGKVEVHRVTHGLQNRSQEPAEPQDAETKDLALAD